MYPHWAKGEFGRIARVVEVRRSDLGLVRRASYLGKSSGGIRKGWRRIAVNRLIILTSMWIYL